MVIDRPSQKDSQAHVVLTLARDVHRHGASQPPTTQAVHLSGVLAKVKKYSEVSLLALTDALGESVLLVARKEDLDRPSWDAVRELTVGARVTVKGRVGQSKSGQSTVILTEAPTMHAASAAAARSTVQRPPVRQILAARLRQRAASFFRRAGYVELEPLLISASEGCPRSEPLRVVREGFGAQVDLVPSPAPQLGAALAAGAARVFTVGRRFATIYKSESRGPESLVLMAKALDLTPEAQHALVRGAVSEILDEHGAASPALVFESLGQPAPLCDHGTEVIEAWRATTPDGCPIAEGVCETVGATRACTITLELEAMVGLLSGNPGRSPGREWTANEAGAVIYHRGEHDRALSETESMWRARPLGSGLARGRAVRYDAGASHLCAPLGYSYPSLAQELEPPSQDWIGSAFRAFVRGEFGAAGTDSTVTTLPRIAGQRTTGLGEFVDYLQRCTSELVHGEPVQRVLDQSSGDVVLDLHRLVTDPALAHGRNRRNVDLDTFRHQVGEQVAREERLIFALPGYPHKSRNPLRTLGGGPFPDGCELVSMIGLHVLAQAIQRVYPAGAEWVILPEGEMLSGVFGFPVDDAIGYRNRLQQFRNALHLQGTVSIVDLSEMIDNFRAAVGAERVDAVRVALRAAVRSFALRDDETGAAFRALTHGMQRNIDAPDLWEGRTPAAISTLFHAVREEDVERPLRGPWRELQRRAVHAGIEYATAQLLVRYCDIVNVTMPGAVRATVRAKRGQLGVLAHGSAFPWHAVPFRREGPIVPGVFESRRLHELADRGPLRRVLLDGEGERALLYLERA